jgi:DUF1680 family protein
MRFTLAGLFFFLLSASVYAQPSRLPLPFRVPAKMPDRLIPAEISRTRLQGYLGERVARNEKNRLLKVDLTPLLAGFRQRPGNHPWIGEHFGKWLHAATLAWAYTGDPALKTKMDEGVRELLKTQEADGYLGTYTPDKRFGLYPGSDWDVWSHKYNLIGLLTYYQYTGSPAALQACRKMGDLLIRTFGPGKKSILSAGTHVGMAATSVLEPIVLLYRHTGDPRYLDFARYLVASWEEPGGPRVLTALTTHKSVNRTANGKAYEMLSNLVGLCELARVTGDRQYLIPAVHAWDDVVANHLYITGSASRHELFQENRKLPNQPGENIGETCVTVTWIQLTSQLLRLTGEPKYGAELERTYYNHLAGAQRPDGAQWCYYTALEGRKPYGPGINCCVSSGPRGMAMAPLMAYFTRRDPSGETLVVNLFEPSQTSVWLNGQSVRVRQTTAFPRQGGAVLSFGMDRPVTFGLAVRAPAWVKTLSIQAGSQTVTVKGGHVWAQIPPRRWREGEQARIQFDLSLERIAGTDTNQDRAAMRWGPFILAYDAARNPGLPPASVLSFAHGRPRAADSLTFTAPVTYAGAERAQSAVFVPFAEAGANGSLYRVWLGAPGVTLPFSLSLLYGGEESRSRVGNVVGSIADGEPSTFVVTFDGTDQAEDWYAVTPAKPITFRRVVYMHGQTFHDGGWFDASRGKPRIQIQRAPGGDWESIGALEEYPDTTAVDSKGIRPGQAFTLSLSEPVRAVAVRIIGVPAHGDNPRQRFSSCAELQAFER